MWFKHSDQSHVTSFVETRKTIISSSHKASLVLALSSTAKDLLINLGVNKDKIFLNPIGVDSFWKEKSNNEDFLKKYNINKKYFLYVSHFYRYKVVFSWSCLHCALCC